MNIMMLNNTVSQLHIHQVFRFKEPKIIWSRSPAKRYSTTTRDKPAHMILAKLDTAISPVITNGYSDEL